MNQWLVTKIGLATKCTVNITWSEKSNLFRLTANNVIVADCVHSSVIYSNFIECEFVQNDLSEHIYFNTSTMNGSLLQTHN